MSTGGKATEAYRMRTTQQFSVTLPQEIAEVVEAKVKSGAYASVSEVMRDGVRALIDRDAAIEKWLREEVIAGHQEYLADPSKGVPRPKRCWSGSRTAARRDRDKPVLARRFHAEGRTPARCAARAYFAPKWRKNR